MKPALVIFDCDGVLVDSERPANRLLQAMLAEQGVTLSLAETEASFVGLSLASCVERVRGRFGVVLPDDFIAEVERRTAEVLAREVRPVPGVTATLARLPCSTCVASSGAVGKMRLTLGRTGLLPLFEGRLFSAAMVRRGKPAPDLFLHAAAEMGVDAAGAAVVEDSPFGIQAAVAAGMLAVGFTGGGHRELTRDGPLLTEAGAAFVVDRMEDLPPRLGFA